MLVSPSPCYFTCKNVTNLLNVQSRLLMIRVQGLRLMRPEKVWQPIVTVQVDQHHCHETKMGVDGQNPNLKQGFELYVLIFNHKAVELQLN